MTNEDQIWISKAYKLIHPYYSKYKTVISENLLAGLIYVECLGLNPKEKRFEPKVHDELLLVKKGISTSCYPGFNYAPFKEYITKCSIDDLVALATSYGLVQIMGYNYFKHFCLLPHAFENLTFEESVKYSLAYMEIEKAGCNNFAELCRKHNTGSPHGITKNADYVSNAERISSLYASYIKGA